MKKSLEREDIIKNTSFFSFSNYIARTMFFLRGFLNARILGPSLYGLWSALNIISNYSSYMHLGSINGMSREIPYQIGRQSTEGINKTRNAAFMFCLVTNFIFSFILIITAAILWKRLLLNESIGLIAIACFSFIFSLHEFYKTALIAAKRFTIINKVNIMFPILTLMLTLILVPRFKIYGVYLVAILTPLASLLYMWVKETYRFELYFDFKEIFRLIKIGFPLMSINFLDEMIISIAGIMVLFFLGKVNLGYFSVAVLMARFLIYFHDSIHETFEPYIYQRYGERGDMSELKKYLFKPTLIMALLFPIVLAVYYTVAVFFIRAFLPKYSMSICPFSIILISNFFVSFSPTVFAFIIAINKQKFLVPVFLIGVIIMFVSGLIFINMAFDITGVAIGFLLSSFFIGSVIFIYAVNHYISSPLKCLSYLVSMWVPFFYMVLIVILNEGIVSHLLDIYPDILNLALKLVILLVFSLPLIYIAETKTRIVSNILNFLRTCMYSATSTK